MPFTRTAMLPIFLAASGTGAAAGNGPMPHAASAATAAPSPPAAPPGTAAVPTADPFIAPVAVADICAAAQPRSSEALRTAR